MSKLITPVALILVATSLAGAEPVNKTEAADPPLTIEGSKGGVKVKSKGFGVTARKVSYDGGKGELVLSGHDFEMAVKMKLPDSVSFTVEATDEAVRVRTKYLDATPDTVRYDGKSRRLVLSPAPDKQWTASVYTVTTRKEGGGKAMEEAIWMPISSMLPAVYSLRNETLSHFRPRNEVRQAKD